MNNCATAVSDEFRCPTKWELWRQLLNLLPRGRAWQSHEDVVDLDVMPGADAIYGLYELGGSAGMGSEETIVRLTRLQQYWAAYAEVLEHLHQRACALLDEMFCATTSELRLEWGTDYGYPDACEPYDTLCDKVRAEGGATCAYLATLAARLGWVIECTDCGPGARADCASADCTPICECEPNIIRIRLLTAVSPAWIAVTPMNADAAIADCTPPCAAIPEQVVCLIEKFKPAHVRAIYEVF